jgi:hypothetical protein
VIRSYEGEAESFLAELEEEYYENGAGLKDAFDVSAIYARHERLFDRERVRDLLQATETKQDRHLAHFAAHHHLERAVCELTEEITTAETRASLQWDGQEIPYRRALALAPKEPDRPRRLDLTERVHTVTGLHNPLRTRRIAALHAASERLGFASYPELCGRLLGVDVDELAAAMGELLARTEADWRQCLTEYLEAFGIPSADAHIADLRHLITAPQFDRRFPREMLMPSIERTAAGLGIDLAALGNLTIDTGERPLKAPRAFCCPVWVPTDVRLVTMPHGGREDYGALLHETGHALHFAHVRASADFAFRCLGDNSVSEAYAFLFNMLLRSPAWLSEAGIPVDREYLRFAWFYQLYFVRRLSGRLGYERELHQADSPPEDLVSRYQEHVGKALKVRMAERNYLADVDDGLYCTCYLRAWMLEVQLRQRLTQEFGSRWFADPGAGSFLKGLWASGQEFGAEEIAQQLGFSGLDPEALASDLAPPV